jgi:hypothetical protein
MMIGPGGLLLVVTNAVPITVLLLGLAKRKQLNLEI